MRLRIPLFGGAAALAVALAPNSGQASSHREAPFIARMPQVDGTDFYMFNSYETGRLGYVTILANYLPLQDGYGGPNYFSLDPDALYEIHIDNTGDGVEDITFQFQFKSTLAAGGDGIKLMVGPNGSQKAVAIPVIVAGPVADHDNELTRNQVDSYTINMVTGPRRTGNVAAVTNHNGGTNPMVFNKPLDNIGPKSFSAGAGYASYAKSFVYNVDIPGCTPPTGTFPKVFVGQRQEPFPVNLGEIFDLLDLTATNGTANALGDEDQGHNIVSDKNITTIALEIPASCLVAPGKTNIGGWTTASVRQARVINPTPTFDAPSRVGGPWVQVSRLGMPLVNEVVIGLPDKNKFNSSEPKDDGANFADYITNPTLPEIVELVFGGGGVAVAPNRFPRTDLLNAFALGITGVNDTGTVPSEMIRLNTTTASVFAPRPPNLQSNFGAALCIVGQDTTHDGHLDPAAPGCDASGFPNGRRPGDDVVDIELRVAMGYLLNTTDAPSGQLPLTDGATFGTVCSAPGVCTGHMAANFDATFPYLKTPLPGAP
jgi:hypothetical protein